MNIKRKIIALLIIIVVFMGGIGYFIVLPTINDIKTIKEAVQFEKIDLEKKYQRGQLLNKVLEEFEKIQLEEDKLKSVFIRQGEELQFVTSLEEIAENFNIKQKLKLEDVSEKRPDLLYSTLKLSVDTQGRFIDTLKYIEKINQLSYYYNVQEISITDISNLPSVEGLVETKMQGDIYIIAPNKE